MTLQFTSSFLFQFICFHYVPYILTRNWQQDEPNNWGLCVAMTTDGGSSGGWSHFVRGKWNDMPCHAHGHLNGYICESEANRTHIGKIHHMKSLIPKFLTSTPTYYSFAAQVTEKKPIFNTKVTAMKNVNTN